MKTVFIARAGVAYQITNIIGVLTSLPDAIRRCKDRPFADEEQNMVFDRWWVEEWEINGLLLRQYDLLGWKDGTDQIMVIEAATGDTSWL